jgi:predicted permease
MFPVTFHTAAVAVAQIFIMGSLGFYLVRSGIMNEEGLKLISFLTVNIIFPLFIFYQIITNYSAIHMSYWWAFPLVAISLPVVGLMISSLLLWRHKRPHKTAFLAVCSLHNGGYLPLLIVTALPLGAWAASAYAAVIFSIVGFDMCIWSIGVWLLTREQSKAMDFKKILNAPLLSMFTAWLIVLIAGPNFVPEIILKPVHILGEGTMGFAMLLIGGNLGMVSLARINWMEMTTVVLLKLIVLPLVTLIALMFLKLSPLVSFIAMLSATMPCSITLSIIGRNYNTKDQPLINQAIFVTHLLSMITIPIFLGLYGRLL